MKYIFRVLLVTLSIIIIPSIAFAHTTSEESSVDNNNGSFSTYTLYNDNMSIDLPNSWYFNTPHEIDEDFIEVTENSASRLKRYLSKQHVEYNLVSSDLNTEINIIVLHDSQSKLIFDYNTVNIEKLKSQIETLVSEQIKEEKAGDTQFTFGTVEKIGASLFTITKGIMTEDEAQSVLIQYSTIINGYGINISIKSYDGINAVRDESLIMEITKSFNVKEVLETNRKKQSIIEFLPAALLLLGFISIGVVVFIKEFKKVRSKN